MLIETAGGGRRRSTVARLADVTAVVLVPEAGIMEIADVYILNKAELAGHRTLEREVRRLAGDEVRRAAADVGTRRCDFHTIIEKWLQREGGN